MSTLKDAAARASEIAEQLLFPAASDVDRAERVPEAHFAALANAGLYRLAAPATQQAEVPPGALTDVAEALASGCLATAFVWVQHNGLVRAFAESDNEALRTAWLADLCAGKKRAGLGYGGAKPGAKRLVASATDSGWRLTGQVPWVTGWGMVDVLEVWAVTPQNEQLSLLLEPKPASSLKVTPRALVAANASCTVQLDFEGRAVPFEQTLSRAPYTPAPAFDGGGRLNGSLALGVTRRCCQLLGPGPLDAQLQARRTQLDTATPETLAAARAAAVALALQASTALVVASGSRSILTSEHAQRLAREALFLSVFGSRPAIRSALLNHLLA